MKFANLLIELRKEAQLSQKDLAEKIGISQSAIAKLELERNEATASTLLKLSKFFNVSIDYLLGVDTSIESFISPAFELKPDEQHLLDTYRKLNAYNRMKVTAQAASRSLSAFPAGRRQRRNRAAPPFLFQPFSPPTRRHV